MEQADNYEFHRERFEKEAEQDEISKSNFSDEEMNKLQKYFEYNIEDYMVDDPDIEIDKFMDWFEGENYQDLLKILNK